MVWLWRRGRHSCGWDLGERFSLFSRIMLTWFVFVVLLFFVHVVLLVFVVLRTCIKGHIAGRLYVASEVSK